MWMNLIVLLFVIGVAYFYSVQGLFSALLHLVLMLIAGSLALAAWEPLTINFLIERMPEMAWGVGLLAPFVIILLILRLVCDKLILGNLDFNYLGNSIGGGIVGFIIGIITAGYLVISLSFIGTFSLIDYKPYTIENGQITRAQSLWVQADDISSGVFSMLSGGAFHPFSGHTTALYEPNLQRAAGTFQLTARRASRRALRPSNVTVTDLFALDQKAAAEQVAHDDLKLTPDQQVIIIGTDIITDAAADPTGQFTASAAQVGLLHGKENASTLTPPVGYLINNTYGTFNEADEFARAKAGISESTFHWVFVIPSGDEPRYLRLKQLRLEIPEVQFSTKITEAMTALLTGITWNPAPQTDDNDQSNVTPVARVEGPAHGMPGGAEGIDVAISAELPIPLNGDKVRMSGRGGLDANGIVFAQGNVPRPDGRLGKALSVDQISYDPRAAAIVRLKVAPRKARSLFGKAVASATNLTTPVLIDSDGGKYRAIGVVRENSADLFLDINTESGIRTLQQAGLNNLGDNDHLFLYFRVGLGTTITQFQMGRTTTDLTVNIPRR